MDGHRYMDINIYMDIQMDRWIDIYIYIYGQTQIDEQTYMY